MNKKQLFDSFWVRINIGLKLAIFPALTVLAVAGFLIYTSMTLRLSKTDALVIDMAGRQRMLNQRHLKEILLRCQGFEADYHLTRKMFNETLQALTKGGSVIINLETGEKAQLPPAKGDTVLKKLAENQRLIIKFTEKSDQFMELSESDPEYQSKLNELYALNTRLHLIINDVVKLFRGQAESRISTMIRLETAIALLLAIFVILYWRISTRSVVKPLNNVVDVSKKISISIAEGIVPEERVDIASSDEIGQMGIIFNEMIDSVAQHISERKKAAEALRESEERYRELVEGIDAIVWEADPETWRFSFVSQQAEKILGYPTEQWLRESDFWVKHMHPEDRDRSVSYCKKCTSEGQDHDLEYRARTADGRTVWLHDIVRVVKDDKGRVNKLRGLMVDITDRKQAEEKASERLEELERWYKVTVDREVKMAELKKEIKELKKQLAEARGGKS